MTKHLMLFIVFVLLTSFTISCTQVPPPNEVESQLGSEKGTAGSYASNQGSSSTRSMREQADPTIRENRKGIFLSWHHDEFLQFGDPEQYVAHRFTLSEISLENQKPIAFEMKLPESIVPAATDVSVDLEYDGNFANGTVPVGSILYYSVDPNELVNEEEKLFMSYFSCNQFTGDQYTLHESEEATVGAFIKRNGYTRYVTENLGDSDNIKLDYLYQLEDKLFHISFNVGSEATKNDLKLYDAIVDSIVIAKEFV